MCGGKFDSVHSVKSLTRLLTSCPKRCGRLEVVLFIQIRLFKLKSDLAEIQGFFALNTLEIFSKPLSETPLTSTVALPPVSQHKQKSNSAVTLFSFVVFSGTFFFDFLIAFSFV